MTKILKFIKGDRVAWNGVEMVHFNEGKVYAVPDEFAIGFIQRGSAVEYMVEIHVSPKGFLVGTPIVMQAPPPPITAPKKRGFFARMFRRK